MTNDQVSLTYSADPAARDAAPVGGYDFLEALAGLAGLHADPARRAYEARRDVCDWLCTPLATWARGAYGDEVFETAARGYADFCLHVARARHDYAETGRYTASDPARIFELVYEREETMTPYMWAKLLTYVWWPDMTAHLRLYRDAFLERLPATPRVLELACGHGVLGLMALEHRPDAILKGYDISPPAIRIANRLAAASPHAGRARFVVRDVQDLDLAEDCCDGIVAAMVAEHLADPHALFAAVARCLAPGGRAFVSTSLESPQRGVVHEFRSESEPLLLAEEVGLRVERLVCDTGDGEDEGMRPRGMAMVLRHA